MVNAKALESFARRIPDYTKKERDSIFNKTEKYWDTSLRRNFWHVLESYFCKDFNAEAKDSREYIFVEKLNPIPRDCHKTFFGAKMIYPDSALIMPNRELKIAIELDHNKDFPKAGQKPSKKASKIIYSLSKASVNVISGQYHKALLLFFVDSDFSVADFPIEADLKKVLRFYEEQARTSLCLIYTQ